MLVLGVNSPVTKNGKCLREGGLCIIKDGKLVLAVAEERISRTKYSAGFDYSLQLILENYGIALDDFDAIVLSSCCETVPDNYQYLGLHEKDPSKISFIPSHHLSHAYSTFLTSPFERAIILVMDAGGNVLVTEKNPKWWLHPREQNSYFIGEGERISLIGRDFDQPLEVGFGEAYRAFTYYLGWHSYTFSSNTMALAAFGDPNSYKNLHLFEFSGGRLLSRMVNNPEDPIGMVRKFANEQGIGIPSPCIPGEEPSQEQKDLASYIQHELEEASVKLVTKLVEQTGIRNLCIAGGVGLNCVANREILDRTPIDNIFIQPASGDTGQALGNALFGYHSLLKQPRQYSRFTPYLGPEHDLSIKHLTEIIPSSSLSEIQISEVEDLARKAAHMLDEGKIIAWYQGRSEYGPRALGNRSILADPRYPSIREQCHILKKREFFRPFAPSILEELTDIYFDLSVPSPYMLLVAHAKPQVITQIPAVLHADNTARLQTVSNDDNPLFYKVISEFYKLSGVPLVLNTSFNNRGEPIVETPKEAVDTFLDMNLDALFIGNVLIEKSSEPPAKISIPNGKEHIYNWQNFQRYNLIEKLRNDFPNIRLVERSAMGIYSEHIDLINAGRKSTTIRYRPGAIEFPNNDVIPVLNTGSNGRRFQAYPAGRACIKQLIIKKFGMLDNIDAKREGYKSREEMLNMLHRIYNHIRDEEFVSIYHIDLKYG